MSENNKTLEEYIKSFARDKCEGNEEEAKEYAIVKEVAKSLEK